MTVMLLSPSTMDLQVPPAPWDALVRRSADLLQASGTTTSHYVDAIFDSLRRNGDYMLVAPRVLLAHARPESGALGTGISLVTTTDDIPFSGDAARPVRLFFTLSAVDSDAHLELLTHLATVLTDDALLSELSTSSDATRVASIINPAQPCC
ncbi:MAG: PTS sugar transporter subunit IIA [Acidipropionibacterium sp.]|jgi:PTS system ascorbate-specific IIA component|nr:PTS sugar transporter subunit IIA [Acidipropionibacterium sp.]